MNNEYLETIRNAMSKGMSTDSEISEMLRSCLRRKLITPKELETLCDVSEEGYYYAQLIDEEIKEYSKKG